MEFKSFELTVILYFYGLPNILRYALRIIKRGLVLQLSGHIFKSQNTYL